ncbi:hypothetical protein ACH3VR_04085 [Microbacterium sp. B2969]|uniref:Uncharacterized protein n=1 Tax=Microbacterium alkaliflavum TaxID=3248839 RepID=A0ABW7Q3X6_9MICO
MGADDAGLTRRSLFRSAAWGLPLLVAGASAVAPGAHAATGPVAYANPRPLRNDLGLMATLSLKPGQTYKGAVPLTIQFDPGVPTPTSVTMTLGRYTRQLKRVGTSSLWSADPWDTTKRLAYPDLGSPSNYMAWVRADAVISGMTHSSPTFSVYTGNYSYGALPDKGWSDSMAWAADYSSWSAWLDSFTATVIGVKYASMVQDPIRRGRKAIKVTVPDYARLDADQPTKSPRFQAQQSTLAPGAGIFEGQEFYVGFSTFVPKVDSSAAGSGGFPSVRLSDAGETNLHIAIFQMYGPQASSPTQYPSGRGAITIIDANRTADSDPLDRFHIDANQLNGGDPGFVVDFGYNRGAWTDIVLGFKMSADVRKGWIEVYLNQGGYTSVQPVTLFGGLTRLPRVSAWPESSTPAVPASYVGGTLVQGGSRRHRTDMQLYRSPTAYQEATMLHTAHRVGPSPEAVDPKSYA